MHQAEYTSYHTFVGADTIVFRISPTLDFRNAKAFLESCERHVAAGRRFFVLDLSAAGILDSCGLGAIFTLYRQLIPKQGRILFAAPSRSAEAVIDLVRAHKVFGKYPSVSAALAQLDGAS